MNLIFTPNPATGKAGETITVEANITDYSGATVVPDHFAADKSTTKKVTPAEPAPLTKNLGETDEAFENRLASQADEQTQAEEIGAVQDKAAPKSQPQTAFVPHNEITVFKHPTHNASSFLIRIDNECPVGEQTVAINAIDAKGSTIVSEDLTINVVR